MDHFTRHQGKLRCEDVDLEELATLHGTPLYVYSTATITRHVRVLREGLRDLPHHICFAVKSNSNIAILGLMKNLDCGFDAVSGGELAKVRHIGARMDHTILSGVGKRDDEILDALRAQVMYICIESREELESVSTIAKREGVQAKVAIRVNPDVDPKTHPYISTGLKTNKFGVPFEQSVELYRDALTHPSLEMVGVTCHIGSQITTLSPFIDAADRMKELARELMSMGAPLRYLGMGGGLGIPYQPLEPSIAPPPSPKEYGEALRERLGPLNLTLVLEPGRVLIGNAGILMTKVVRLKRGAERSFAVVDAGMNELIRPALYQAHHDIETILPPTEAKHTVDVVGPVCESSDTFATQRKLPPLKEGTLLAIRSAGAYGMAMASSYNGRPLPAEILCNGSNQQVIRKRDDLCDLWRGEFPLQSTPNPS